MKIVTVSSLSSGGAATAAHQLHLALTRFGHECAMFTLVPDARSDMIPLSSGSQFTAPAFWRQKLFENWSSLSMPEAQRTGACELFSDTSCAPFTIKSFAKSVEQADIVHLHWISGIWTVPAFFRQLPNKKIVWTVHDMNPFTGGCHYHIDCRRYTTECGLCPLLGGEVEDDASSYGFFLKQHLYPLLDVAFACPSQWMAEKARQSPLLRDRLIEVIPNAHDTRLFAPGVRSELRSRFGIAEENFLVLAGVDDLNNPRKNMAILGEALRLLSSRASRLPLTLLLFGHGKSPETSYETKVFGQVAPEQLAELYSLADVFVHPSRLDNLPNTLCEAQCCGTPVISFDVGGARETFSPGNSGVLLPENSPEALAEALQSLAEDKVRLEKMRTNARVFALRAFDPVDVARRYTALYETHLERRSRFESKHTVDLLVDNMFEWMAGLLQREMLRREEAHAILAQHESHLREVVSRLEALEGRLAKQEDLSSKLEPICKTVDILRRWFKR